MQISLKKPITVSLSPNDEKDDVALALKLLFQPYRWKKGEEIKILENKFKEYFKTENVFLFNSGRSSLLAILYSLNLDPGDDILIQGYTCNAAINPIIKSNLNPIFVDIDDNLNMDPSDLEEKITPKSKAVIIQHTFGYPAQIDKIKTIAQKYHLYLIEDCAHSLGARYKGRLCGTFGDVSFFSFGRDKIISSVYGGAVITNNEQLASRIKIYYNKLKFPSSSWTLQQLLHPVLFYYIVLPTYNFLKLGRIFLILALRLHLISRSVLKKEMNAQLPNYFPRKLPNALSSLALHQFLKLNKLNQHRIKIAQFYQENIPKDKYKIIFHLNDPERNPIFMRYPILIKGDPEKMFHKSKEEGIILYDGWSGSPIIPKASNLQKFHYKLGVCPRAEKISLHIVNLPTNINTTINKAEKIINFLKRYGD